MLLRHLPLPALTPYSHAQRLQETLVSALLAHKAHPTSSPAPPPTVITAEFFPVYTCGRREIGTVTAEQRAFLREPVRLRDGSFARAEFHEAMRGGQTTFHGPGQLVAYPIVDLRRHGLSPRCYVRLLETAVISLLERQYGISSRTTENPGVWVDSGTKICALGVHLRRHVSSHGVGLNVSTEMGWFERIVGCGLEGKGTTSVEMVVGGRVDGGVERAGKMFVGILAEALRGVEGVEVGDVGDLD